MNFGQNFHSLCSHIRLWSRIGRHVESDFLVKMKRRVERKSEALISAVGALCSLTHQDKIPSVSFVGAALYWASPKHKTVRPRRTEFSGTKHRRHYIARPDSFISWNWVVKELRRIPWSHSAQSFRRSASFRSVPRPPCSHSSSLRPFDQRLLRHRSASFVIVSRRRKLIDIMGRLSFWMSQYEIFRNNSWIHILEIKIKVENLLI